MFLILNHICPNNLSLWQSMTKPQQTNKHMIEVTNYPTHTHLLNTIKSILTQILEKTCMTLTLELENLFLEVLNTS